MSFLIHSGTHRLKLAMIGKSQRPRALRGVKHVPVQYFGNKNAWVTRELFSEWFTKNFIPAAREQCTAAGLPKDYELVLIMDNCTAHPPAETLSRDYVTVHM